MRASTLALSIPSRERTSSSLSERRASSLGMAPAEEEGRRGGREGGREGREGEREGGREGGKERGRGGRQGGRVKSTCKSMTGVHVYMFKVRP